MELIVLAALAAGGLGGYRQWHKGPDLPNSTRFLGLSPALTASTSHSSVSDSIRS